MKSTLIFALTGFAGMAFSIFYVRYFLFNPKVHALSKLLSLMLVLTLAFILQNTWERASRDIDHLVIEGILGFVLGAIVGIFIPSLLKKMSVSPKSHKNMAFIANSEKWFERQGITWNNATELKQLIQEHWHSLINAYSALAYGPPIINNVPVFIDEMVKEMTRKK